MPDCLFIEANKILLNTSMLHGTSDQKKQRILPVTLVS